MTHSMTRAVVQLSAAALLLGAAGSTALAATAQVPLPVNGTTSVENEAANKVLVLNWATGNGAVRGSLMDRNFIQHDVEEPSGSVEFLAFFSQPGGPPGPNGGSRTPANAALKAAADAARAAGQPLPEAPPRAAPPRNGPVTRLAVLTDGNLTMMIYPTSIGGDPGAVFGSNLFETRDGKITQEWYSGPTFTSPPNTGTPAPAPDYTQWYPAPFAQIANVQVLVPIHPASRAQRDANRRLVARFWQSFFVQKKASAGRYLAADLKNHLKDQPSGAAFAAYARQHPEQVTAPDPKQVLFMIADGDMVDIGFPVPMLGDPGAWYAQNLVRVKDGRIVEWWYSGFPTGAPTLRYGASWPIGAGPRPGTTD
ncbi:MAG TPA: hypothetical protein VMI92_11450 [Steroidobacteraceae bacterium]|nr:hypothetical protein [Steroidobacteraceae bacterium]